MGGLRRAFRTTLLGAFAAAVPAAAGITPSTPYYGKPLVLPGLIQAFEFDRGGEGVAYHDTTPENTGSGYRSKEGVDVCTHFATGGGFRIGWARHSEWVQFSFELKAAGRYQFLYAGTLGEKVKAGYRIELERHGLIDEITVPPGDWNLAVWLAGKPLRLEAGVYRIRVNFTAERRNSPAPDLRAIRLKRLDAGRDQKGEG